MFPAASTWIVRCDATPATGLGHLSRCLGLAEALRERGCRLIFAGHYAPEAATLIDGAGFAALAWHQNSGSSEDASDLSSEARRLAVSGLIVDDYRIDGSWLSQVKCDERVTVVFDDAAGLRSYAACDGVINYSVVAPRLSYFEIAGDRIARGPRYFPARRALGAIRRTQDESRRASRILVTLGGTDRFGATAKVLDALARVAPDADVRALVAPATMADAGLAAFARHLHPTSASIDEHYQWADVCVAGGGLTKYECAYVGLPAAIYSQTIDQEEETRSFCAAGLGFDLGGRADWPAMEERLRAFLADAEHRHELSDRGREQLPVDGPSRLAVAVLSWSPRGVAAATSAASLPQ